MKKTSSRAGRLAKAVFAGALALTVLAATSAFADDATNPAASPIKHSLRLQFNVGPENSEGTNYHGLPKEAFDRLSPEQIVELVKSDQPPASVLIIAPVAMFAMVIACVWLRVSQRSKRAALLHDTMRLMIEKGQPIPPELLQQPDGVRRPRNDLRNGLLFIALGVGLGILFLAQRDDAWPVALIPLLIGVAFLVTRKLEQSANGQPK